MSSSSGVSSNRGGGGTFCRFSVGRPEQSVRYLRYIARDEAVREGGAGVACRNLPDTLPDRHDSYSGFVAALSDYAKTQARQEIASHRWRGQPRTHYRATLSFERDPGTSAAKGLVMMWLAQTFPLARAAAFLHRNSASLHCHVWIEARQTSGRKINLNARAYRQIDEAWNRHYAPLFARHEAEHLHKKWQTEGYKQLRREGKDLPPPARVSHKFHPALFTERERARLGEALYERNESGIGNDKFPVAGGNNEAKADERGTDYAERATRKLARSIGEARHAADTAHRADDRAVSETDALYQAASELDRQPSRQHQEITGEGRER